MNAPPRPAAPSPWQTEHVGFYGDQVLPRFVDVALRGRAFDRLRARAAADLDGEVVEVGFGSGRNVPFYPDSVTRVRAVDPAVAGRKLAANRVAACPIPIDYVGLDGEQLPVEDATVDHVLTTWTLCSIPDVSRALAEIRRVLRPGGTLHFVEHGRAPDPNVAKWQDRLTPWQRRIVGGCHLNRQIDTLIAGAGLTVQQLDTFYVPGPKPFAFTFAGVATKSG
jgi:ubiquinone/menaquinone biosynthesis C-methylase UbiE